MLQWYTWLYELKKKDEGKKMEVKHKNLVGLMIKSADGGTGLVHKITKSSAWRGGALLKEEEKDATPLARCEEKRKAEGQTVSGKVAATSVHNECSS